MDRWVSQGTVEVWNRLETLKGRRRGRRRKKEKKDINK
jgi:hypothetical protein